jgi:truncated hemoglobin YjbI
MGQQLRSRRTAQGWRSGGQNLWLSRLVDAMEKLSRPEMRAIPCDRLALAAVRAQLARPASAGYLTHANFSLRN